MAMRRVAWVSIVLLLISLISAAGCTRSPEAKKARHLDRGDKYFGRAQYREAIIEYRNVLRFERSNTQAIRRLGLAHYQMGEPGQAFPYLLEAKDLEPENLDVRLALGTIYLLQRQPKDAREAATFVLDKAPKNLEALLLWAATVETPADLDAAIHRLKEAGPEVGGRAKLHLVLANLYLRKRDPGGAERALREAVAREPGSAEPRLVLGDF